MQDARAAHASGRKRDTSTRAAPVRLRAARTASRRDGHNAHRPHVEAPCLGKAAAASYVASKWCRWRRRGLDGKVGRADALGAQQPDLHACRPCASAKLQDRRPHHDAPRAKVRARDLAARAARLLGTPAYPARECAQHAARARSSPHAGTALHGLTHARAPLWPSSHCGLIPHKMERVWTPPSGVAGGPPASLVRAAATGDGHYAIPRPPSGSPRG
jgi:hypothetical protein